MYHYEGDNARDLMKIDDIPGVKPQKFRHCLKGGFYNYHSRDRGIKQIASKYEAFKNIRD